MRILTTKRAAALVMAFAALMVETCSLPLSAGPRSRSARQAETPGGAEQVALEIGQRGPETTISVETALVNLDVLVTDQDGRVLSVLEREIPARRSGAGTGVRGHKDVGSTVLRDSYLGLARSSRRASQCVRNRVACPYPGDTPLSHEFGAILDPPKIARPVAKFAPLNTFPPG